MQFNLAVELLLQQLQLLMMVTMLQMQFRVWVCGI